MFLIYYQGLKQSIDILLHALYSTLQTGIHLYIRVYY